MVAISKAQSDMWGMIFPTQKHADFLINPCLLKWTYILSLRIFSNGFSITEFPGLFPLPFLTNGEFWLLSTFLVPHPWVTKMQKSSQSPSNLLPGFLLLPCDPRDLSILMWANISTNSLFFLPTARNVCPLVFKPSRKITLPIYSMHISLLSLSNITFEKLPWLINSMFITTNFQSWQYFNKSPLNHL